MSHVIRHEAFDVVSKAGEFFIHLDDGIPRNRMSLPRHRRFYIKRHSSMANIQILTASSAMVKTMTPEVIPGAFYFPEAKPRENRTLRGSPYTIY